MSEFQDGVQLGRLERVDVRTVWGHEAVAFTPWLVQTENLELLSSAVGIPLALEATEQQAGMFRADVLCKDMVTGQRVVIENQLGRTDHGHLGQVLTYASGLDAFAAVWIASSFTDEHRAVLDWLNRITLSSVRFFGVEIELWSIGQSAVAPRFNLVSAPNSWTTSVNRRVSGVQILGSHRDRIKQAMLLALQEQREFDYSDIAVAAGVGYSTVKKYAPAIKQELLLVQSVERVNE